MLGELWSLQGRYRTLHLTWFAFFLTFVVWFNLAPLATTVKEDMGLELGQIRTIAICNVALTVPARVIIGMLLDKFGPRLTYSAILVFAAIPCLMFATAQTFGQLVVARLLLSIVGARLCDRDSHGGRMVSPQGNRLGRRHLWGVGEFRVCLLGTHPGDCCGLAQLCRWRPDWGCGAQLARRHCPDRDCGCYLRRVLFPERAGHTTGKGLSATPQNCGPGGNLHAGFLGSHGHECSLCRHPGGAGLAPQNRGFPHGDHLSLDPCWPFLHGMECNPGVFFAPIGS